MMSVCRRSLSRAIAFLCSPNLSIAMFHIEIELPTYKKTSWGALNPSGKTAVTWSGSDLLEGNSAARAQIDELLRAQDAENKIVADLGQLESLKEETEKHLGRLAREVKKAEKKLALVREFLTGLGFDPNSDKLTIADGITKQLKSAEVEAVVEGEDEECDEDEDEEYDEDEDEECDPNYI